MVYSVKGINLIICVLAVMVYLIVAAMEDRKSMEVTRIKHLIGFLPAQTAFLLCVGEQTGFDIGALVVFMGICLLCGW